MLSFVLPGLFEGIMFKGDGSLGLVRYGWSWAYVGWHMGSCCKRSGDVYFVKLSKYLFIPFSGSLLLESKINPNTAYQKQQASITARLYFFSDYWCWGIVLCFMLKLTVFQKKSKAA